MARCACFLLLLFVCIGYSFADTKSDILSLTGNARTKLVWVRFPWCDENYNPVQEYSADKNLYNEDPHTQLIVFDTDNGSTRYLDSTIGSHCYPRLTRSGSHVIWTDRKNGCAWIRDFAGVSPRRKLIDGGDYIAVACARNSPSATEYLYVETADEKGLCRIPFNDNYELVISEKQTVYTGAAEFDRGRVTVSADGLYVGCSIPWPECSILQLSDEHIFSRKAPGAFGCEPCLAPDNSYRFFHLQDNHKDIRMWQDGLSETYSDIDVSLNMPGISFSHDCVSPRWTNNVRFFTNSYSLLYGYEVNWDKFDIFSLNPDQVKADDPAMAGSFCLGRFSEDFKSVDKYVRVSDGDIRHRDVVGDAWIADGGIVSAQRGIPAKAAQDLRISVCGSLLEIGLPEHAEGHVTLSNGAGQVIERRILNRTRMLSFDNLPSGIIIIKAVHGAEAVCSKVLIAR